ncbi:MAG TPA: radical SAM protein [Lentisphaeria bacterium]|nr:MAG: hypothetical protein A2X45_25795 [Lentisphaerae bacterium GWF2_50_93]HCE42395.1 radical SAM protein [Lentisphaeria bacterium]
MAESENKSADGRFRCMICPRKCGVDRVGESGYCRAGERLKVNTCSLHFGEEPVISGNRGSGTIFFSCCNLRCVFCQNYRISDSGYGKELGVDDLARSMLGLQSQGAHNINLVTPTHFTHLIRDSLVMARKQGLVIPVLWNSSAYELRETLETLEGLVDIYMPDFKYSSPDMARKYSGAADYPDVAKSAIREMFRQVGHLKLDKDGIAYRGLLIRILILPDDANSIHETLEWIDANLGNGTYISLMGQYYPTHLASRHPGMDRCISSGEYEFARRELESFGFENGFIQDVGSDNSQTPDFRE